MVKLKIILHTTPHPNFMCTAGSREALEATSNLEINHVSRARGNGL
jgi:hypothetical protein